MWHQKVIEESSSSNENEELQVEEQKRKRGSLLNFTDDSDEGKFNYSLLS